MPIDVIISPEVEVGQMVLRRIALPGATDAVRFADDKVAMVAIECLEDCPVVNTPLVQLSELFPDLMATVVGVWRNERLFVPHSTDQLETGDLAYVVATGTHVRRTLGLFGHERTGGGPHRHLRRRQYRFVCRRRHRGTRNQDQGEDHRGRQGRAVSIADSLSRTVVLNGSRWTRTSSSRPISRTPT
jgi:trk system potassium uptake protein TrkA